MKKIIVSSWDDGWKDEKLIDFLRQENIKTSFCLVGKNFKNLKNYKIYDDFEVINHTMNHLNLIKCNHKQIVSEVMDCQKLLEDAFGRKIYGFCYPGGYYNDYIENIIFELGFLYTRSIDIRNFYSKINYKFGVHSCIENNTFWQDYNANKNLFAFYGHAAHIDLNKIKIYLKNMKNNGDKFVTIIDYIKKILN